MKDKSLKLIILTFGLIWLKSSWGKLSGGNFVSELGATLAKFASKNPNNWFKNILESIAIPNSFIIGNLVMWGELFVALSDRRRSLFIG